MYFFFKYALLFSSEIQMTVLLLMTSIFQVGTFHKI